MSTLTLPDLRTPAMTRTLAIAGFARTTEIDADNVVSTSIAGAVAIRDANDASILRPLAGATVTLNTPDGAIATNRHGKRYRSYVTDETGQFEFYDASPSGECHVLVDMLISNPADAARIAVVGCDAVTPTVNDHIIECIVHAHRNTQRSNSTRPARSTGPIGFIAAGLIVGVGMARELGESVTNVLRHAGMGG